MKLLVAVIFGIIFSSLVYAAKKYYDSFECERSEIVQIGVCVAGFFGQPNCRVKLKNGHFTTVGPRFIGENVNVCRIKNIVADD